MALDPYHSPSKRPRIAAAQFISSPLSIAKEEALRLKRENNDHIQLRNIHLCGFVSVTFCGYGHQLEWCVYLLVQGGQAEWYISSEAIPYSHASNDSPLGYQVCVSPRRSGTNKFFQELIGKQERFDSMELYVSALYSSVPICAADLTMVPMYILDYHIRRIFLEKKHTSANPQIYQALFVGKGKNKPFKGTSGDQIRYAYLLKCWKASVGDEGSDFEDEDKGDASKEQLENFEDLLHCSEDSLLAAARYCGHVDIEVSQIRVEALAFLEGEEKKTRDVGAHVFTQLFYQQRRTPLEKQHLEDRVLPPENDAIFKLAEPEALVCIGLKILAVADLERRLNAPAMSPYRLATSSPNLTRVGVDIVKSFIKLKGNFTESVEFRYGSLRTSIVVGGRGPSKFVDLLTMGEEGGGCSEA